MAEEILRMMELMRLMISGHRWSQKLNCLKHAFSKRAETLSYDPVTISIVATSMCTLSCDMCPTHSAIVPRDYPHRQNDAPDMGLAMFREIIDRFSNATTVHIIGSGEPLLAKDFFRMVDYAASKNMVVKTFSNGTVIEENIDNILNPNLDGITISLNGHTSSEFRRMTGMDEKYYDKILAAVKKLVKEKKARRSPVKVKLSFIIDKHNYRHIPEMVEVVLDTGVDHAFFCNFLPCPYGHLGVETRVLTSDDKIKKELNEIFSRYPAAIRKKLTPPVLVNMNEMKDKCSTHFSQIRFDGGGNVSSCSMMLLNMEGNGNLRDADVWNNLFFRRMRKAFLSGRLDEFSEPCKTCPDNKGVCINI
jgi:MoaA/NifB/PqqE/SkfB family radical SAM enzyme